MYEPLGDRRSSPNGARRSMNAVRNLHHSNSQSVSSSNNLGGTSHWSTGTRAFRSDRGKNSRPYRSNKFDRGISADHSHERSMHSSNNLKNMTRKKHGDVKMEGTCCDCMICCRESDVFGLGSCRHPICMECVIRLRIITKNSNCPTCRGIIDEVIFVKLPESGVWDSWEPSSCSVEHADCSRYKLKFSNEYLVRCYDSYLAHVCGMCEEKKIKRQFNNFVSLNHHVNTVHRREFCELCKSNLHLLSRERRTYSQFGLQRHINFGDSDDSSLRGHPKCGLCVGRFFDEDDLYKHLRREHFFCQVCDSDGVNTFCKSHEELIEHYKAVHVICEEGECKRLGIAFKTKIELSIHKASEHSNGRKNLILDLPFNTSRSARRTHDTFISHRQERNSLLPLDSSSFAGGQLESCEQLPTENFSMQIEDFPRLDMNKISNDMERNALPNASNKAQPLNSWIIDDEEFPNRPFPTSNDLKTASSSGAAKPVDVSSEACEIRFGSCAARWICERNVPDLSDENFPSLSGSKNVSATLSANSAWITKCPKPENKELTETWVSIDKKLKTKKRSKNSNDNGIEKKDRNQPKSGETLSFSQKLAAAVASFNNSSLTNYPGLSRRLSSQSSLNSSAGQNFVRQNKSSAVSVDLDIPPGFDNSSDADFTALPPGF